ncbi:MAG: fibronectin type III domain-containing protein [Acidimicrobiia bacterium]
MRRAAGLWSRSCGAVAAVLALVLALLVAVPALPAQAAAVGYARAPLDGWDVDGAVYALEVAGDTLYLGGEFTRVVSPDGTASLPRLNLAAIDLGSGEVLPFRADSNGRVTAIEASGSTVFVGGSFSTIGGVAREGVAAVGSSSGAVLAGFDAGLDGGVLDLEIMGSRLYVAGSFTSVYGDPDLRYLAALDPASGGIIGSFDADPDQPVYALAPAPAGDRIYAGGAFFRIGGVDRRWLRALDPTTGAAVGPFFATVVSVVMALEVSADGGTVYGGIGGSRNAAIAWNANTGALIWDETVAGDVQAIELAGGNLFFGFHDRSTSDPTVRLLAADAATGELESTFRPPIDSGFGVWAIAQHTRGLIIGGTFTQVSGVRTRGFAVLPALSDGGGGGGGGGGGIVSDTTPPSQPTGLVASAVSATGVSLSWNESSDAGSGVAYYQVTRGGAPVASVVAPTHADAGLSAVTAYTYRVAAVDVAGNISAYSAPATVTTGTRFTDVEGSHLFSADIEWLASTGITRGCNPPANDRFCPEDPVTRGQMAAFLNRALSGR